MEQLENLSDEVTEGRSNVRVEEERVEHGGWIMTEAGRIGRAGRIEVLYVSDTTLYSIRSAILSQWSVLRTGVMWWCFRVLVTARTKVFE